MIDNTIRDMLSPERYDAAARVFARYTERANLSKRKADPRLRFYSIHASDDEYRTLNGKIEDLLRDASKAGASPSKRRLRRIFFLAEIPEPE